MHGDHSVKTLLLVTPTHPSREFVKCSWPAQTRETDWSQHPVCSSVRCLATSASFLLIFHSEHCLLAFKDSRFKIWSRPPDFPVSDYFLWTYYDTRLILNENEVSGVAWKLRGFYCALISYLVKLKKLCVFGWLIDWLTDWQIDFCYLPCHFFFTQAVSILPLS